MEVEESGKPKKGKKKWVGSGWACGRRGKGGRGLELIRSTRLLCSAPSTVDDLMGADFMEGEDDEVNCLLVTLPVVSSANTLLPFSLLLRTKPPPAPKRPKMTTTTPP
jgi:hypothetical protein